MNETGNPGIVPRNEANQRLFNNAHEVQARELEPSSLYYPEALQVAEGLA